MIQFEKVAFKYPGADHYALVNVTLEIPQGSFFALLGPNGAGKTTLLRLLCGRFSRAAHDGDAKAKKLGGEGFTGDLIVAPAFRNADGFLNARCYGVLLENPGVYPKLSIEEYLSYFAGFYGMGENACMPSGMARARVEELAERLELPALQSRLSTLSLGNRQKVQIVRALVHNPKVLILDEPVANLDPNAREMVWKLIAEWREKEGGTAIVCSHILAEMEEEATDYAIIDGGRVIASGLAPSKSANAEKAGGHKFSISVQEEASLEQIKQALAEADIRAEVVAHKSSLADIHRNSTK